MEGKFEFGLIIIIALLPVGPALTALLSVMGKLVRKKDINVTKDFFRAYKRSFLKAFFIGTYYLLYLALYL